MVSMTTDSVVTEAMDGARDIVPTIQKRQENVFQYNLHLWERDCACGNVVLRISTSSKIDNFR